MGLFSSRKGQEPSGADRGALTNDPVQAARAQARRRLVGAAVLLGIGVIGFPLLFETQPRPVPVDIAIDIPRKDNAPSLPLPPPRVASASATTPRVSSGVITERPAAESPKRDSAPTAATATPATKSTEASTPVKPSTNVAPPPAATKPPAPAAATPAHTPSDDGARAKALLEGKPIEPRATATKPADTAVATAAASPTAASPSSADKPDAGAANGRFVVQVAAYSEAGAAREMRQRLEKLGLKSYTQVIEIDGAKRIRVRVGPFSARDDADKAAATLKAAGLPAAVLSL